MIYKKTGFFAVLTIVFATTCVFAQDPAPAPAQTPPPIAPDAAITVVDPAWRPGDVPKDVVTELILDSSGSMKQKIQGRTKLFQAKRVLSAFMRQAQEDQMRLGLRVYGQEERNCTDTKLTLKFGDQGPDAIDAAMAQINPKGYGKTPLALSLLKAAEDMKPFKNQPRRIIAVTDGLDTCGGDPCAVATKLKQEHDIRIFVVGYGLSEEEREKLKCLGDAGAYFDANDLQSLLDAMKKLSDPDKNLIVKSPDPTAMSEVWEHTPEGLVKIGEFVSSMGTHVQPEKKYEVRVLLKPVFTFKNVVVQKGERKVLHVTGNGVMFFRFMKGLFTVSLLNDQGGVVATFRSDEDYKVPAGFYKVRAVSPPFADELLDDVMVAPNGRYEEQIKGYGTIQINVEPARGGPFGYYVFNDTKKQDMGSYLTGLPLVLPIGRYMVKSAGNSMVKNIYPDQTNPFEVLLPPPGKTVVFKINEKEDAALEAMARAEEKKKEQSDSESVKQSVKEEREKRRNSIMLDSMTPEQLRRYLDDKEKNR